MGGIFLVLPKTFTTFNWGSGVACRIGPWGHPYVWTYLGLRCRLVMVEGLLTCCRRDLLVDVTPRNFLFGAGADFPSFGIGAPTYVFPLSWLHLITCLLALTTLPDFTLGVWGRLPPLDLWGPRYVDRSWLTSITWYWLSSL